MKKLTALLLAVLMLCSVLAACAKDEPAPSTDAPAAGTPDAPADTTTPAAPDAASGLTGDVTVWVPDTWATIDAPEFVKNWQAAIEAQYPDVNVTFEEYVESGILEKLTVAMATGTTPDVFFDVYSRITPAATSGLLADVGDLAAQIDFSGNYGSVGQLGGETLYLPFASMNCYSIAVNMDIAREVGAVDYLPEDGIHWSYDDFLKCCQLAKDGGYYGTQLWAGGPTGDAAMFSLYMSAGSQLFSDDLTTCTIDNDGSREALGLLQELLDNYVPAGAATTVDYNEAFFANQSLFSLPQGGASIIMARDKSLEAGEIDSVFDMDFVMYPSPKGDLEPVGASFGTRGFCFFKNEEDPDTLAAAKAIVKLVYDDPIYMAEMCTNAGTAPVLASVTPEVDDKYIPFVEKGNDFTARFMTDSFGILEGWWGDWRSAYFPVMQKFYAGDATIDETLAELEAVGNQIIADYQAAQ